MLMSLEDFVIKILAYSTTKIATPLLEVESGIRIFIFNVGIVFDSYMHSVASTVGFACAFAILTNVWEKFISGTKYVM